MVSDHKSALDLGHPLQTVPAAPPDPRAYHVLIHQVCQEGRDGTAVEEGDPSQEDHYHGVDVLELVAVGEHLAHQFHIIVKVDNISAA